MQAKTNVETDVRVKYFRTTIMNYVGESILLPVFAKREMYSDVLFVKNNSIKKIPVPIGYKPVAVNKESGKTLSFENGSYNLSDVANFAGVKSEIVVFGIFCTL